MLGILRADRRKGLPMREYPNPFTPTFGKVPAVLAGRDLLLHEMDEALRNGNGDPNLCSLFSGSRGVGKTVLLAYLADRAADQGWVTANVTARPGMLEDIIERATEAADGAARTGLGVRITSVNAPVLFGATWEYRDPGSGNWRTRMNHLLDRLEEHQRGLLITIDEIDPSLEELIDFAAVYQHFVRENRRVALFMAGLPASVSALLSDKSASFLRRAAQHVLGRIDDVDVRVAFRETVEEAGKSIDDDALSVAVEAVDGFAYMMQLVGFRTWAVSGEHACIKREDAVKGASRAREDFIAGVVRKTCQELSEGDMAFLEAMLPDGEGPSSMSDIAVRMGKSTNYARVYRTRLVEQGVVTPAGRGLVQFDMPLLREFLMEE